MMVKTKEEIINQIADYIGENPDDSGLLLLENVTDTLSETVTAGDVEEQIRAAVAAKDEEWRKRYRDRFLSGPDPEEITEEPEEAEVIEKTRFEELFVED